MLLSFKWMVWCRIARNGAIIICRSKIRSLQYCRRPVILAFEQFLLGAAKACMLPLPDIYILTHRQPVLKREDRLGKHPFAGFGTVVEDIKGSGYTKNQPILLGAF